jgi:hypothetical protein
MRRFVIAAAYQGEGSKDVRPTRVVRYEYGSEGRLTRAVREGDHRAGDPIQRYDVAGKTVN